MMSFKETSEEVSHILNISSGAVGSLHLQQVNEVMNGLKNAQQEVLACPN